MQNAVNIVITGGHAATTAIAVIKEIQKRHSNWNLFWVGPKSAVEGKFVPTLASSIMPTLGVKYVPVTTGRLQRKFTVWTIPSLLKIPYGVFQSFQILFKIKPKVVVGFGGYASVPVCFAAWVLRIPVFIHEQTIAAGLANKINSVFAKRIFIARKESMVYFPINKTVHIGNPVASKIIEIKAKTKLPKVQTIYITGGSSGAQRINKVIKTILYDLLKDYYVIHQTGALDFKEFKELQGEFPTDLKKRYEVYPFIDPKDIPSIYDRSDLVIGRAGANTVSEILITKRPAILIPIPWSSHDEQTKNARSVEKSGLGVILEEKDLSGENLLTKIEYVFKNWQKMVDSSDDVLANLDRKASQTLVEELEREL